MRAGSDLQLRDITRDARRDDSGRGGCGDGIGEGSAGREGAGKGCETAGRGGRVWCVREGRWAMGGTVKRIWSNAYGKCALRCAKYACAGTWF